MQDTENTFDSWMRIINKLSEAQESRQESDAVNHPEHYQSCTGLEAIEVIEAFQLNYNLGNAVKYILRSGKKGAVIEDIQKAIWYLKREKLRLSEQEE